MVAHHLAKVRVAGSNPVVRSEEAQVSSPGGLLGGMAERRGNGLQSRVHGFESRSHLAAQPVLPERYGRLAQRESASLTRKRSLVQSQYRPPASPQVNGVTCLARYCETESSHPDQQPSAHIHGIHRVPEDHPKYCRGKCCRCRQFGVDPLSSSPTMPSPGTSPQLGWQRARRDQLPKLVQQQRHRNRIRVCP